MKTKRVTWSCRDGGTVVCHDSVAIVHMTDNMPLVHIFDGEGNRIDFGQYRTLSEAGAALSKALNGEKLTMIES